MKQPHPKPVKKSETLEVRLSHPDKLALQDQAAREGRTVSAVVRGLISSYLAQAEPRSHTQFTELLMTLKSRPKTVFVTLACLPALMLPILFASPAVAEDISLSLQAEFTEPVFEMGADGKRIRRFNTDIEIGLDQFFSMPVMISPSGDPSANLHMSFRLSEGDNQIVTIEISICEIMDPLKNTNKQGKILLIDSCDGERLLAQPHISAKYGETAEFLFSTELPINEMANEKPLHELINGEPATFRFDDDSRRVFKLKASPKKL